MSKSNYFKKYNHHDGYVFIFNNLLCKYLINTDGYIVDLKHNPITRFVGIDGELYVKLQLRQYDKIPVDYKVSHLVQHTFKPTKLSIDYYWDIDVLYVDGNKFNLHPSNLVWHWTKLIHYNYPGYAIIPGASKYCIDINGNVINSNTGNKLISSISDGYYCISIQPDIGNQFKARIHRLKCLAWKDYPANIDDLEVNHIDGIKINNDLVNLEWTTAAENKAHADKTGLFINRDISILARFICINNRSNIEYKNLMQFRTMAECGRYFKVDEVTIGRRIKLGQSILYVDLNEDKTTLNSIYGVQFKLDDGNIPWEDVPLDSNPYLNSQVSEPIKYRDITTDEIKLASSSKELSKILNISLGMISHFLNGKTTRPVKQYEFKYLSDNSGWLYFTDEQIELYRRMVDSGIFNQHGNGYRYRNRITNESVFFTNCKDISQYLNTSEKSIIKRAMISRQNDRINKMFIVEPIVLFGSKALLALSNP